MAVSAARTDNQNCVEPRCQHSHRRDQERYNSMDMLANIQTRKDVISVSFITRPTDRESASIEEKLLVKNIIETLAKDPNAPQMHSIRADGK